MEMCISQASAVWLSSHTRCIVSTLASRGARSILNAAMRTLLVSTLLLATACSWESPTAPLENPQGKSSFAQPPAGRRRAAGPGDVVAQPQCANPAPLQLAPRIQAAPGYIVVLDPKKSGLTIPELQARYNVQIKYIYDVLPGFSGEMSAQAVSGLRCEPNVVAIAQNSWGTVTNVRP